MSELFTPGPTEDEDEPVLYYANCHDFVVGYMLPSWRHTFAGARWCQLWWRHAEAVNRLDALWRSFEVHRHGDPSGMAVWWRDFADPTMSALTRPDGPFSRCSAELDEHDQAPIWPSRKPPAGLFMDERAIRPRSSAVVDDM